MEKIRLIREGLENLRAYFCTDGQEIPIQFVDNQALLVTSMLQLCDQTTRKLVTLFDQQKGTADPYITQENIYKILAMRASNNDDEAIIFLERPQDNIDSKVSEIITFYYYFSFIINTLFIII